MAPFPIQPHILPNPPITNMQTLGLPFQSLHTATQLQRSTHPLTPFPFSSPQPVSTTASATKEPSPVCVTDRQSSPPLTFQPNEIALINHCRTKIKTIEKATDFVQKALMLTVNSQPLFDQTSAVVAFTQLSTYFIKDATGSFHFDTMQTHINRLSELGITINNTVNLELIRPIFNYIRDTKTIFDKDDLNTLLDTPMTPNIFSFLEGLTPGLQAKGFSKEHVLGFAGLNCCSEKLTVLNNLTDFFIQNGFTISQLAQMMYSNDSHLTWVTLSKSLDILKTEHHLDHEAIVALASLKNSNSSLKNRLKQGYTAKKPKLEPEPKPKPKLKPEPKPKPPHTKPDIKSSAQPEKKRTHNTLSASSTACTYKRRAPDNDDIQKQSFIAISLTLTVNKQPLYSQQSAERAYAKHTNFAANFSITDHGVTLQTQLDQLYQKGITITDNVAIQNVHSFLDYVTDEHKHVLTTDDLSTLLPKHFIADALSNLHDTMTPLLQKGATREQLVYIASLKCNSPALPALLETWDTLIGYGFTRDNLLSIARLEGSARTLLTLKNHTPKLIAGLKLDINDIKTIAVTKGSHATINRLLMCKPLFDKHYKELPKQQLLAAAKSHSGAHTHICTLLEKAKLPTKIKADCLKGTKSYRKATPQNTPAAQATPTPQPSQQAEEAVAAEDALPPFYDDAQANENIYDTSLYDFEDLEGDAIHFNDAP